MVPPQYSLQECAACGHKNPANRLSQAECVCQDCEHTENADHNAAVVLAKRGINKLLSGDPLTKTHKSMRIFRKLGPERSEVTPGAIAQDTKGQKPAARRSMSQETPTSI